MLCWGGAPALAAATWLAYRALPERAPEEGDEADAWNQIPRGRSLAENIIWTGSVWCKI